jgi:3-(3-hydroxy-phenyl)propionate hydroxylase
MADYLIACDGARSPIRRMMGLDFQGRFFEERFLITDVEMKAAPFSPIGADAAGPSERRFWFEPTFHSGQSALLHKQPDDIYRIDLQLGPDADPEEEKKPERVIPRIKAMVGDRPFTIDWVSVYSFQCRRLERFVHGRVLFVGDSAHVVSPFGARGGNSGIQDADNLAWKLAAVVKGEAPERLLESYNSERVHGADENIRHSSRATNFMTPKSQLERVFRQAVLELAADQPFARRLINSGRLSVPCSLAGFELETPCEAPVRPGMAAPDAPLSNGAGETWLLNRIGGDFALVSFGEKPAILVNDIRHVHVARPGEGDLCDREGHAFARYGTGITYLFRPDQHVAAAFTQPTPEAVRAARDRALGGGMH